MNAAHLRFGDTENKHEPTPPLGHRLSPELMPLIQDIAELPLPTQTIIREVVDSFMRLDRGDSRKDCLPDQKSGKRHAGQQQCVALASALLPL